MIAAGQQHSVAFTDGAELITWGDNRRGQLGDGSRDQRAAPSGVLQVGLAAVTAGGSHCLAITESGGLLAWGANDMGQLGDGSTYARLRPVQLFERGVSAVSAGWHHSLAVVAGGELLAWGMNYQGQLGDGSKASSLSPKRIVESGIRSVAAGWYHSLALTEAGGVLAWGANESGQLGDASASEQLAPVTVLEAGIAAVAVGFAHSLALTLEGEVLAWGSNEHGQAGGGPADCLRSPTRVLGGARAIAAGHSHSLALTEGGEVLAWGANDVGQLGDGSTVARSSPGKVLGLGDDVCALAAGWHHSLARGSERGACWAWGCNEHGQLGSGPAGAHGLVAARILEDSALEVHPSYFAISFQQLAELAEDARAGLGARYRVASTRGVVERVIKPMTAHTINRGYARHLNEGQLLPVEAFVSHCWDGNFKDLVEAVNAMFRSRAAPPNLWICATALWQGPEGEWRTAWRPGLEATEAPFVRVMERAQTVLVVRNTAVDFYARLWCVWELFAAERQGFLRKPGGFMVAGSNQGFESHAEVDAARCEASLPEDRQWLLSAIGARDGLRAEVGAVATRVRSLYYR